MVAPVLKSKMQEILREVACSFPAAAASLQASSKKSTDSSLIALEEFQDSSDDEEGADAFFQQSRHLKSI